MFVCCHHIRETFILNLAIVKLFLTNNLLVIILTFYFFFFCQLFLAKCYTIIISLFFIVISSYILWSSREVTFILREYELFAYWTLYILIWNLSLRERYWELVNSFVKRRFRFLCQTILLDLYRLLWDIDQIGLLFCLIFTIGYRFNFCYIFSIDFNIIWFFDKLIVLYLFLLIH